MLSALTAQNTSSGTQEIRRPLLSERRQPPPTATRSVGELVDYLTRYLTGGPISDYRITAADEQSVTFMAREGTRVGGERKQVPITLSLKLFMQRWCLHILPEQLTKTRYFGGWSNNRRDKYMARCRDSLKQLGRLESDHQAEAETACEAGALPNGNAPALSEATESEAEAKSSTALKCSHCGSGSLALVSKAPKPSWRDVFWRDSETCPAWYAALQREEHRLYWIAEYGKDIYDCYMRLWAESAKEKTTPVQPTLQPYLPSLTLVQSYETIPF